MTKAKFVLHWLNRSRAQRVVWLLEELNLDYELKFYKRDENLRAPKELTDLHPLGKSPILEIINDDGTSLKLAESGYIFQYLLEHYDKENKLTPTAPEDQELVKYFLHYTEGSIQPMSTALVVNEVSKSKPPLPIRPLMKALLTKINHNYWDLEMKRNFDYLELILKEQHEKNRDYFVGDKLTAADLILSFPIYYEFYVTHFLRSYLGEETKVVYPHLYQWLSHVMKENGWKLAAKRVEEYESIPASSSRL
ncbi:uncharacterized protein J8A68_001746 [[Candida] subhashii]|uniref:glutathione transferase n=1 Tax=[Candida] subhashii TaxID=561895 RepID=A0A8J5QQ95_9ASCO|nr:uncharacterized protein J8A68_001746 [[Candida] subhashii]KAG7664721.1 hypothetical protein J8A68_001746 [[Candida] subhashii]